MDKIPTAFFGEAPSKGEFRHDKCYISMDYEHAMACLRHCMGITKRAREHYHEKQSENNE